MNPTRHVSTLDTSLRCLTHPSIWLALAFLLLNDHLLKALVPSWLTDKLGDVGYRFCGTVN